MKPRSPESRAVRRVVAALSVSAFIEWGGATAVLPLLPIYLQHRGASATLVGITMSAFFAAALLVQYPLGRLSDRIGRRKIQAGGLVTFAVASVLFAFVGSPVVALFLRALQGCGAGIVDVANVATIAEVVPESFRGRAYGSFYGARNVSMAIGPFFGGLAGLAGMRWLFLAAAVAAVAAVAPILLVVPARRVVVVATAGIQRIALWRNRAFWGVAVAFVGVGLVIGVYEVCWSLLLQYRGASNWEIGVSWTLFSIPFAVVSLPAGWLVDHVDRRYLVAVALLGSGSFAITYPFLHSVALLVGLGCFEASLVALGAPAESAQLAQSVRPDEFGRAQGAAASVQTGATAVAAAVSGTLFAIHPWIPFVGAGVAMYLGVVVIWPLWRGIPSRAIRPAPVSPATPATPATGPVQPAYAEEVCGESA